MKPDLIGGGSSIFDTQEVSTSSGLALGTVGVSEGRSFVWCSHTDSSTLIRGEPLVAQPLDGTDQNLDITTNGLGIGQTRIVDITAGSVAIAANAYNEGFLAVLDGSGAGNSYAIKRSLAFTAGGSDGEIFLKEAIVVASDADTQVSFVKNKYANPRQSRTGLRDPFVGVPNVTVPDGSTTPQFFWAQRNGYCPAFVMGTPPRGASVVLSTRRYGRFAGAVEVIEVTETGGRTVHELDHTPVVGQMVTAGINNEVQVVDLQNPMV